MDTIYFTDYSSKKKQDKKFFENFYSAAMAGEYTLEQYTVTKTELVPENDSSDDYFAYSAGRRLKSIILLLKGTTLEIVLWE